MTVDKTKWHRKIHHWIQLIKLNN